MANESITDLDEFASALLSEFPFKVRKNGTREYGIIVLEDEIVERQGVEIQTTLDILFYDNRIILDLHGAYKQLFDVSGYAVIEYADPKFCPKLVADRICDILLDLNIEYCPNCGAWAESIHMLPKYDDVPDGYCVRCRPDE